MKPLLPLILLFCLLFGCTGTGGSSNQKDISRIIFATGYCHGECPFQAIEIDSSLAYKYYGGQYAKHKGYFQGVIANDYWDSLNSDLIKLEYWNLDTIYDNTYDDQSIEIIIYSGNHKKHIRGQNKSLPKNLQNLVTKLSYSVDLAKIKTTKDIIKFETTVQEPLDSVEPKFPPAGRDQNN